MNVSQGPVSRKRWLEMSKALTCSRYRELADHRVVESPWTDIPSKGAQVSLQKAMQPWIASVRLLSTIWRTDEE